MRTACALLVLLVMAAPLGSLLSDATDVNTFEGGASTALVALTPPGFDAIVNISVPNPAKVLNATLNVSTSGDVAPLAPFVDAAMDGTPEWGFNGTGYGPFGNQDVFANGSDNGSFGPAGAGAPAGLDITLPKYAEVRSATVDVTAVPAVTQATNQYSNVIVSNTGPWNGNVSGVPQSGTVTGAGASLALSTVVLDQSQLQIGYSLGVGNQTGPGGPSIGQSFTANVTGTLNRIDLYGFITPYVGNPVQLVVEIRDTNATGVPVASNRTFVRLAQSSVISGWFTVNFPSSVDVVMGNVYAIVLSTPSAPSNTWFVLYGSGSNSYNLGKMFNWINVSASGNPTPWTMNDLTFRTYVSRPLASPEIANVTVNGTAATGTDAQNITYYNFSNPVLVNGQWNFTVMNSNIFTLNITTLRAYVGYEQYPSKITLDVGGDSTADWSYAGTLVKTVQAALPVQEFKDHLYAGSGVRDAYGNMMTNLSLNLSSITGPGSIVLNNLNIYYNYSVSIGEFGPAVAAYLAGMPNGTVSVPVGVKASSAGNLTLKGPVVRLDTPPVLAKPIPDLTILEGGGSETLLNMYQYFVDDFDFDLTYNVLQNSQPDLVKVEMNWTYISAKALDAHWTGTTQVVIVANDSAGQKTTSNLFNITVLPVNDPPIFTSVPLERAEAERNWSYRAVAREIDNDRLTYKLDVAPAGMLVNSTGFVNWTPHRSFLGTKQCVTLSVSDGNATVYQWFNVTVYTNNTAPVPTLLGAISSVAGRAYACQLSASDADGDQLFYFLVTNPAGMLVNSTSGVITWAQPAEGVFNITLKVTDTWYEVPLNYTLTIVKMPPPAITSVPVRNVTVGKSYSYQVVATTVNGSGSIRYSLASAPAGMMMSPSGLITWSPSKNQTGAFNVLVNVSNDYESATQSYSIDVAKTPAVITPPPGNSPMIIIILVVVVGAGAGAAFLAMRSGNKGTGGGGTSSFQSQPQSNQPNLPDQPDLPDRPDKKDDEQKRREELDRMERERAERERQRASAPPPEIPPAEELK